VSKIPSYTRSQALTVGEARPNESTIRVVGPSTKWTSLDGKVVKKSETMHVSMIPSFTRSQAQIVDEARPNDALKAKTHSIRKPINAFCLIDLDSLDGRVVRLSETVAVTIHVDNERDSVCTEGNDE
jgi:hypothetical protein